jgi:hypothetical protein
MHCWQQTSKIAEHKRRQVYSPVSSDGRRGVFARKMVKEEKVCDKEIFIGRSPPRDAASVLSRRIEGCSSEVHAGPQPAWYQKKGERPSTGAAGKRERSAMPQGLERCSSDNMSASLYSLQPGWYTNRMERSSTGQLTSTRGLSRISSSPAMVSSLPSVGENGSDCLPSYRMSSGRKLPSYIHTSDRKLLRNKGAEFEMFGRIPSV